MRRHLALLSVTALLALSLGPAAVTVSASTTYTVTADMPSAVPAGHVWAFNDYFPRALTVARGSTISFPIEGFHTVSLLAKGTTVAEDLKAAGIVTADTDDTTLNPNGTRRLMLRFAALAPQLPVPGCGTLATPCSFTGSATVSSGVPHGPAPFIVSVDAAPGTYWFHCRIHAHMVASLTVVASSSQAQTAAQVQANATAQLTADVAQAKAAETRASTHASTANPNGTRTWFVFPGTMSANRFVSILEMLPRNVSVHKGDRVLWVPVDPTEPHTVTFPGDLHTERIPLCEGPGGTDTPATPTVIPPTGPQDFACGSGPVDEVEFGGGNGVRRLTSPTTVADSGLIGTGGLAPSFGLPSASVLHSWSVRIEPTAVTGVYHYVCQIHDGMAGTITVH